jgi:hypothetical protein
MGFQCSRAAERGWGVMIERGGSTRQNGGGGRGPGCRGNGRGVAGAQIPVSKLRGPRGPVNGTPGMERGAVLSQGLTKRGIGMKTPGRGPRRYLLSGRSVAGPVTHPGLGAEARDPSGLRVCGTVPSAPSIPDQEGALRKPEGERRGAHHCGEESNCGPIGVPCLSGSRA